MNLKKFLYAGLLVSSLTTVIFAESITFITTEPVEIEVKFYAYKLIDEKEHTYKMAVMENTLKVDKKITLKKEELVPKELFDEGYDTDYVFLESIKIIISKKTLPNGYTQNHKKCFKFDENSIKMFPSVINIKKDKDKNFVLLID